MKVALLGATKGIGRALARRMAGRGDQLFRLGRDLEDLERSARDLEVRGAKGKVGTAACDLGAPQGFEPALAAAAQVTPSQTIDATATATSRPPRERPRAVQRRPRE